MDDYRLRPGDQPLPSNGQMDVGQAVMTDILRCHGISQALKSVVVSDLAARIVIGKQRYGKSLQTFNGRSAALDAYHELLDAAHYFKQLELETGEAHDLYEQVLDLIFKLNELMASGVLEPRR